MRARFSFLVSVATVLVAVTQGFVPVVHSPQKWTIRNVATKDDYETKIMEANTILYRAAESKDEDPDLVFEALSDLEKLMKAKCKKEPKAASQILSNLNGSWRLVFTTGTKKTQERTGGRLNYFPIKAVQSFDTNQSPFAISNGIFFGDNALLQFFGEFEFNPKSRKLSFMFDVISVFGFKLNLRRGLDKKIGGASGLGSDANAGNKAFFNWISADEKIATARGGGGGLALWKRIDA